MAVVPRLSSALALLILCASAAAVTVEQMQVTRDDTHYTVTAVMTLTVPPAIAYRAATDYERLSDFSPSIVSSRRVGHDRLRSQVHLCVVFFCKDIRQLMRYREHAPDAVDLDVVPGTGDLKSGSVHWRFAAAAGTRLRLDAEIEPDFWIPPLIGPYLIARELREQARVTGAAIERLADDYGEDDGSHG